MEKNWEKNNENLDLTTQNSGLKRQLDSFYFAAIFCGAAVAFGAFVYFVRPSNFT